MSGGGPQAHGAPADSATAAVESLSHDGRGVARLGGKVVFIEGALPGETVRFRVQRRRKSYDSAQLLEVLAASPDRVTPPCPHFGVCGGCSLQHLHAPAQLLAKQRQLADNLARIGKVEPAAWLAPLTGPAWGYRRRARLGVRLVPKKGGVLVGFRERRRSFITPLTQCPVLDPRLAALLPALRELVGALSCPERIPQIEAAAGDDATALVVRHLVPLSDTDRARLRAFAVRHGVQLLLQPGGPESIVALEPALPRPLSYRLAAHDTLIEFGPADFVQINAQVNAQMVTQALALLAPQPGEQVLDLFCGLGNFTLPLARRCARVLGIEAEAAAVVAARANAARNGITNAEFRVANLYDETAPEPPWGAYRADKLLLDPPRTGAMQAIKQLHAPLPQRLVYVSCNPATLARDAGYLVHVLGYRLASAGVLDMFPHTSHVESMALFVQSAP